jgi:hypothetical protein
MDWGYDDIAEVLQHLSNKYKVLSSSPRNSQEKKKKGPQL